MLFKQHPLCSQGFIFLETGNMPPTQDQCATGSARLARWLELPTFANPLKRKSSPAFQGSR
ncbi:hypothetical protein IQ249_18450 [Lusitaniella coriacea LEGE 07157]|uniref:Uncharacterized protein n=1 Tax=Lusitaniella coriacea LEGE 07157 TaxID=945747 RepID=A0A8J7DYZ8_9CYAN|nr:hypothetical protein [Lusitaniella coriacea]MBE9117882.1 hypothetical protein [Lusitaniella coriacea LEGE 07157]